MESFREEERQLLAPFVTNVDKNIFVLKNLPEVIKGALFSRYSRTTKGLRTLLLKEFIQNKEVGFEKVALFSKEAVADELLAIEKAQDFYERILDGYGDDSIGELGGAHVAIENISNIATKIIQDARIGGSPLEKSSRYVWFNKKKDGEYMFFKDPRIMASRHKELYLQINRRLFETYDKLIEPMKNFFIERIPKDPDTPARAYNFSIRARACDALRGLLPASTLTNMGVFGNGRFFEYLLLKLRTHEMSEMHEIADTLHGELNKVVPAFVRRSHPSHKHFPAFNDYLTKSRERVKQEAQKMQNVVIRPVDDEIMLIDYDKDAEVKLLATLLYPHTRHSLEQLQEHVRAMTPEQRTKALQEAHAMRGNRRHKPCRAFENVYYTFDILADFGIYRDLQRHRMLTQERQDLTVEHGYDLPPDIVAAGFEEEWKACMREAARAYRQLYQAFPKEAQYVVPFAYKIRWYFTMNARSITWLSELRSAAQGHPNYRRVAQKMYLLAKKTHPLIFDHARFVDLADYSLGRLDAEKRTAAKKEGEP